MLPAIFTSFLNNLDVPRPTEQLFLKSFGWLPKFTNSRVPSSVGAVNCSILTNGTFLDGGWGVVFAGLGHLLPHLYITEVYSASCFLDTL